MRACLDDSVTSVDVMQQEIAVGVDDFVAECLRNGKSAAIGSQQAAEVSALQLVGLTVRFDALKAVDSLSMTLHAGERRAIIGPNGAGKTTLFNAISGTVRPASGRIVFEGREITSLPHSRRAHLGIARTFQITNLFAQLTVGENIVVDGQYRLTEGVRVNPTAAAAPAAAG